MTALPLTATDALYATSFPTLEELENFLLVDLPTRYPEQNLPTIQLNAELGAYNHMLLKRIFDSCVDPTVVRKAGEAIYERGAMQAMQANFYIYCHFIGDRLINDMGVTSEQFAELHYVHARKIERLWHGIGEWAF